MVGNDLLMDAISLEGLQDLDPDFLFSEILPSPWTSERDDVYVITMNKPVALQVVLGTLGKDHLDRLFTFLNGLDVDECDVATLHIRTDGKNIWMVAAGQENSGFGQSWREKSEAFDS